jgi:hypothetical protein
MRRPYPGILIASILLTVLYFVFEERPAYITYEDDKGDILFFGTIYVVLLFGTMSAIYLFFKQKK